MELNHTEFEIVINLAEENASSGQNLNDSPWRRDFSLCGSSVPWKEISTFGSSCGDFDQFDAPSRSLRDFSETGQELYGSGIDSKAAESTAKNFGDGRKIRVINGKDIGDLPIEYTIKGLEDYEFPVKGFYVDRRILPGFKYTVRLNGTPSWLFGGESRLLESVGLGYGKRLTFAGDTLCDSVHFWSDSVPDGYAFNIDAVGVGDEFVICDEARALGRAYVESLVIPQQELSTAVADGLVTKRVKVALTITAEYSLQRHGMLSLVGGETTVVEGIAIVERKRRQRKALTVKIEQVTLPMVGICTLNKEL